MGSFNVFTDRQQCCYFHEDHESHLQVFQISFSALNFYFSFSKKTPIILEELLKAIKCPHLELRKGQRESLALFLSK